MHRAALYITWIQSIICCVLAMPANAQLTGQKVLEGCRGGTVLQTAFTTFRWS